ncbi:MAG: DUF6174 domain-containing protein [Planctomycetota bacterium]
MRGLVVLLIIGSIATLPACGGGGSAGSSAKQGSGTVNVNPPPHQGGGGGGGTDEIDEARALWDSQGLTNYDYVLQRSSFSPQYLLEPVIVAVRGGVVVSRTYVKTGLPATAGGPDWWPAIDGLFDFLEAARDGGAETVQVTFDAQRGYPTHAFVDYFSGMADDERGFTVTGFAPR